MSAWPRIVCLDTEWMIRELSVESIGYVRLELMMRGEMNEIKLTEF